MNYIIVLIAAALCVAAFVWGLVSLYREIRLALRKPPRDEADIWMGR